MTKPKDYKCDVHRMCYVGQGSLIIWTIRCHLVISGDYMRSLIGCRWWIRGLLCGLYLLDDD